ncbi:MAG: DNA-directed RNA polymerase subunit omega [Oscillospiraceae bacterium]|nr:DNA-directed RNA polymerase subunit omega [Oscillospiraceae bacterium]MCD8390146.1 DNA-directed RNA polymerase subunit omega [Oscillospiraceae bacterium]
MLLYPPVAELADKVGSRYQLVNVVAQRARQISTEYEERGEPLDEKAVSIAVNEVYAGKLTLKDFGVTKQETESDSAAEASETAEPSGEPEAEG